MSPLFSSVCIWDSPILKVESTFQWNDPCPNTIKKLKNSGKIEKIEKMSFFVGDLIQVI